VSNLFPFINPPDIVIEADMPLPLYKEIAWDFDNNIPIIENGDFKIVEGDEAIKVWSFFAIKTNRYEHSIYSWDFGCEINSLIGQNYTPSLVKAEAERFLKECLLINQYILEVNINDLSFNDGLLSANVKITTIYNQGEDKEVELIV
jgi:hypothetical protein